MCALHTLRSLLALTAPWVGSDGSCVGSAAQKQPSWKFGFQMNERYLKWGESGQGRFLKLHCGEKLGWTPEQVWRIASCCPFVSSLVAACIEPAPTPHYDAAYSVAQCSDTC